MGEDKIRILIASKLDDICKKIMEEAGFEVHVIDQDESLEALIKDFDGIVVRSNKVPQEIIDAAPRLKIICRAGSGVDSIDINHAASKDILVVNTPDANSNSVAELVFSYMLASARNLITGDETTKKGEWRKKELMGTELSEKTLGIIGLGNIGSRLIKKAKGFDMKVIGYDPILSTGRAREMEITLISLKDIFSTADFITLHAPLNTSTKGIITYDLLKLLKKNAMIINAARAELIVKEDFERILMERLDITAALDLFYEGDKPGEKSLASFGNKVLFTPHLGASTFDANYRAAKASGEQIVQFFNSGVISNPVNMPEVPKELNVSYMQLAYKIGKLAYYMVIDKGQPFEILITCYGALNPYTSILAKSGIKGILDHYLEELITPMEAEKIAKDQGIRITLRTPDEMKGHGDSITIDLIVRDGDKVTETSVRGNITPDEKHLIRRIDKFEHIDFIPEGNIAIFTYDDRAGVSGYIGDTLGSNNINILDGRYKTNTDKKMAIAVLNTEKAVDDKLIDYIKKQINASQAFNICFK